MGVSIEGYVDHASLSPVTNLTLISSEDEETEMPAVIDTGYNGEVIMPQHEIQAMGFELLGTIDSELANGQVVEIELFSGRIKWFDQVREVAVGSSRSTDLLLGTLLLTDCELYINFKKGQVTIEQSLSNKNS